MLMFCINAPAASFIQSTDSPLKMLMIFLSFQPRLFCSQCRSSTPSDFFLSCLISKPHFWSQVGDFLYDLAVNFGDNYHFQSAFWSKTFLFAWEELLYIAPCVGIFLVLRTFFCFICYLLGESGMAYLQIRFGLLCLNIWICNFNTTRVCAFLYLFLRSLSRVSILRVQVFLLMCPTLPCLWGVEPSAPPGPRGCLPPAQRFHWRGWPAAVPWPILLRGVSTRVIAGFHFPTPLSTFRCFTSRKSHSACIDSGHGCSPIPLAICNLFPGPFAMSCSR